MAGELRALLEALQEELRDLETAAQRLRVAVEVLEERSEVRATAPLQRPDLSRGGAGPKRSSPTRNHQSRRKVLRVLEGATTPLRPADILMLVQANGGSIGDRNPMGALRKPLNTLYANGVVDRAGRGLYRLSGTSEAPEANTARDPSVTPTAGEGYAHLR